MSKKKKNQVPVWSNTARVKASMERRRSGAAGVHKDTTPRGEKKRQAIERDMRS